MNLDIVKTSEGESSSSNSSMDMTSMMMQMEKLPEFCEPFLNNSTPTNFPETEFSDGSNIPTPTTTTTLTLPVLSNPNVPPDFVNHPIQQPMAPPMSLLRPQSHEVTAMRLRDNANTCSFPYPTSSSEKRNSMAGMREMIFRIAVMQPIYIDPESVKPPKRRNVKISKDPQSVAARHRRERISERIRILQRLVPGGTKMDTASMLDEAIHYVKFLKKQVQTLEQAGATSTTPLPLAFPSGTTSNSNNNVNYSAFMKASHPPPMQYAQLRTGI